MLGKLDDMTILVYKDCPSCGGTGINEETGECYLCDGEGRVEYEITLKELFELFKKELKKEGSDE